MAQETCLDCYRKHIATSMAFEAEASIGNAYPRHKSLAIGQLHAAEIEVVMEFPVLAQITREHRVAYAQDDVPVPTLDLIDLSFQLEENQDSDEESEESFGEQVHSILNKDEDG